jgi:hypothetical protein
MIVYLFVLLDLLEIHKIVLVFLRALVLSLILPVFLCLNPIRIVKMIVIQQIGLIVAYRNLLLVSFLPTEL